MVKVAKLKIKNVVAVKPALGSIGKYLSTKNQIFSVYVVQIIKAIEAIPGCCGWTERVESIFVCVTLFMFAFIGSPLRLIHSIILNYFWVPDFCTFMFLQVFRQTLSLY